MMTGSLSQKKKKKLKKKLKKKKKKRGCSLIRACSLIRSNTVLQNISTDLGLFWDDFRKKIPSETWNHPDPSI